jgi:DNA end-binding protein Ku
MPKAVWTGNLSLGLVNVPVSLYAATEPKDVRFHLVDRAGRRVRYRRFVETGDADDQNDPGTPPPSAGAPPASAVDDVVRETAREVEVAYEDLVRGFEVERDRLVTLEPQEIERARPQPSHTIELEHFVRLADIDPVYFEKSYFLAPRYGSHGEKPYVLLLRAMQEAGQAGIGRFVLRTKPHLVAIRAMDEVLALETLYFGDEVRDPGRIVSWLEGVEVSSREIEMAEQLITMLATEWDPTGYADEYREELLRLIAEKTPTEVEPELHIGEGSPVEDLMEALKASVEAARKRSVSSKKERNQAG